MLVEDSNGEAQSSHLPSARLSSPLPPGVTQPTDSPAKACMGGGTFGPQVRDRRTGRDSKGFCVEDVDDLGVRRGRARRKDGEESTSV